MAPVVTFRGLDWITNRLGANGATYAEPKILGWGTGGVAGGPFTAAQSDVGAFTESAETRVTGTSSIVTTTNPNDTYQVVGTLTATGTRAIAEVLLSDSATKPFTTTVAAGGVVGSSSATTLNTAASYTPANGTYVQIRTEVMQVTAGTGTTALTVVRGVNGSAAIATIQAADTVTAGNHPSDAATVTNSGNEVFHADHGVLNLSSGDSVQYTLKIKVQ